MAICCNRRGVWTEHPHTSHFLVVHSTHNSVSHGAQGSRSLSASRHPCFMRSGCFDTLRPSTLHSSPSLSSSFSFSCSSSSSSMWVGSERSTLCASANEELGTLADNTNLTGYEPKFFDDYHFSLRIFQYFSSFCHLIVIVSLSCFFAPLLSSIAFQ